MCVRKSERVGSGVGRESVLQVNPMEGVPRKREREREGGWDLLLESEAKRRFLTGERCSPRGLLCVYDFLVGIVTADSGTTASWKS